MNKKVLFPILVLVIALTLVFSAPAMACNPATVLTVSVSATGNPGGPVVLTIVDTNTGESQLYPAYITVEYNGNTDVYDIFDLKSGDIPGTEWIQNPGEAWTWEVTYYPLVTTTYVITGYGWDPYENGGAGKWITAPEFPDEQKTVVVTFEPTGLEGLTPGFWKNHVAEWANTGYSPSATFNSVFGAGPSMTLLAAVSAKGGGENALLRHAVAAILNASHPAIDYPMTVAQIIAAVQSAYATGNFEGVKNTLEGYNQLEIELVYNSPNVHKN